MVTVCTSEPPVSGSDGLYIYVRKEWGGGPFKLTYRIKFSHGLLTKVVLLLFSLGARFS
jgi:hypothetical protein